MLLVYVLVSYLLVLSFCALAFVGFLLLSMDTFFLISRFSLTVIGSHGNVHLFLGLVSMHSVDDSIWTVIKFSYLSFGVCLRDVSRRASNLFLRINYVNCLYHYWPAHWLSGSEFVTGPGDWGSISGRDIAKTQKMVLDTSLLNTQHYKVYFKGKVE